MTEENGSNMKAIEEGIPSANGENGASGVVKRQASSRLSLISKQYDVDGDGKLDKAEKAMRDMDKEGLGYLTNDKVYTVFQEQLRMQKQLLFAKRIIIFFAALLVLLAVANIGVAFAAARLAKDTSVRNNVLVVDGSGEPVATDQNVHMFTVTPNTERRLGSFVASTTCDPFCTLGETDAVAFEVLRLCEVGQPVTVRLEYNLGGTTEVLTTYPVCNSNVVESITKNEQRDGTLTDFDIDSSLGNYTFQDGGTGGGWLFTPK